jgi:hypothetical protein
MSEARVDRDGSSWAPPADLSGLERKAWWAAAFGAAASVGALLVDRTQFLQSYLVAWLFWIGLTLGCLAIMMLHHLSGGGWGLMVRRILEAATRTLPTLALLFVPVLLGLGELYPWARPEAAGDELIQHKAAYLNPLAFTIRSLLYLAVWTLFAWMLGRLSLAQDRSPESGLLRRMRMIAAPGLALYCLLASFAGIDWLMSLDPHWYSSIFGVYFIVGHGVTAFAFVIVMALYLSRREPMIGVFKPRHFHDYGKLLLAFVMIWTYIAISQLLIIWSGHLPEEIGWYLERGRGGWRFVSVALALFHFLLPFLLLLSRDLKRNARLLSYVAVIVLGMRWVDLYWLAAPTFGHGLAPHWLDAATMVGVGGVWCAIFARQLQRRPLLPVGDPELAEAIAHE